MLRHPDGLVGGTEFREAVRLEIEIWGSSVADFSNLVRVATEEERFQKLRAEPWASSTQTQGLETWRRGQARWPGERILSRNLPPQMLPTGLQAGA